MNWGTINAIPGSTFYQNLSGSGGGGGIFNHDTITTIHNSTFSGNSADKKGAGYLTTPVLLSRRSKTVLSRETQLWSRAVGSGVAA